MTIEEFLRDKPSTTTGTVNCALVKKENYITWILNLRSIKMYCGECEGERYFDGDTNKSLFLNIPDNLFANFVCRNCKSYKKIFAIKINLVSESECEVFKYGEYPPFGPPTSPRIFNLVGGDRELFLLGRRAEIYGLGIGAFTYYRRVLESQKDKIFDEIIKILKKSGSDENVIGSFENAKKETQFSSALKSIKELLPEVLFIDNHNPLVLLYDVLSNGLHSQNDVICLEQATSIRLLLINMAEKMNGILKEDKEIKEAISKLLKSKREN